MAPGLLSAADILSSHVAICGGGGVPQRGAEGILPGRRQQQVKALLRLPMFAFRHVNRTLRGGRTRCYNLRRCGAGGGQSITARNKEGQPMAVFGRTTALALLALAFIQPASAQDYP